MIENGIGIKSQQQTRDGVLQGWQSFHARLQPIGLEEGVEEISIKHKQVSKTIKRKVVF
ncbi:MAG: hypothetical protein FWE21_04205 [Defluviitaleaceae bacterium]|nr:hypothetical protein [Defluviitaleaceae bacterium]